MALDQTANWTVQMADNLAQVQQQSRKKTDTAADPLIGTPIPPSHITNTAAIINTNTTNPIYLPDEILIQILSYLANTPSAQPSLAAASLLSHQWYRAAIPFLYAHPRLYGKNFDPFASAICPSINLHVRKSRLSQLVRVLDMGNLVHQGSRHMTARLLGRTKYNLEFFRAPQASFGTNCLPALAKCHALTHLDLSLVSESPPLPDLFRTISNLTSLRTLRLPRSAGFGVHHNPPDFAWPPSLTDLTLSGGIDAHLLHGIVSFPQTLHSVTIEHCPQIKGFALSHLLRTALHPLQNLTTIRIAHLPRLSSHALDDILFLLPQIHTLSVSVDYITPALFDESHYQHLKPPPSSSQNSLPEQPLRHHHLHTLELTSSGASGVEDKVSPIDIMITLDDGTLPALRVVRVAKSLFWHSNSTSQDSEALADVLMERSKRDWERREGIFASLTAERYARADWARRAGVWTFEG